MVLMVFDGKLQLSQTGAHTFGILRENQMSDGVRRTPTAGEIVEQEMGHVFAQWTWFAGLLNAVDKTWEFLGGGSSGAPGLLWSNASAVRTENYHRMKANPGGPTRIRH